jgi:hypothetical protein
MVALLIAALTAAGPTDWSRIEHLTSGTAIEIVLGESAAVERRFVGADDRSLTLLAPAYRTLPRRVRRLVQRILEAFPDATDRIAGGVELQAGSLAISSAGVSEAGRHFAPLTDVFETIPSERVRRVRARSHAKQRNAFVGAFVGIPHGLLAGQGTDGRGDQILGLVAMAMAIDAGIGALLTTAPAWELVYERPASDR